MAQKLGATHAGVSGAALETKEVSINAVHLWVNNPRNNDKAVPRLMELLKAHGQRSPLVVWRKNGVIYKGNTTYKAIKALGWPTVVVTYQDFPSESAARAYGISDNVSGEWSEWDDAMLMEMVKADEEYFRQHIEQTGMTEKHLNGLLLSESAPGKLPNVEVEGASEELTDFLIIKFDTVEEFEKAKASLGVGKNQRVIAFSVLKAQWKVKV